MVGRSFHNYWKIGDFECVPLYSPDNKKRNGAFCKMCSAILKNTTKSRLIAHRRYCSRKTDEVPAYYETVIHNSTDRNIERNHKIQISNSYTQRVNELKSSPASIASDSEEDVSQISNIDLFKCNVTGLNQQSGIDNRILPDHELNTNSKPLISNVTSMATVKSEVGENVLVEFIDVNTNDRSSKSNHIDENRATNSGTNTAPIASSSTSPLNLDIEAFLYQPKRTYDYHNREKSKKKFKSTTDENNISPIIDIVTNEQKIQIDQAFAKFIFGCNIPVDVIESNYFKNFISLISPTYKIPTIEILYNTILDSVYDEIRQQDIKNITAESVMLTYRWSSADHTKLIMTLLQNNGNKLSFLACYDINNKHEMSEEYKIYESGIKWANSKYNTRVNTILYENTDDIFENRETSLIFCTCSSYVANLLIKDIVDAKLISKVTLILEEFRKPNLIDKIFENGGTKQKLTTLHDSFQCLIENLHAIKKIIYKDQFELDHGVIRFVEDDEFIARVTHIVELLTPINKIITRCHSLKYSIADTAEDWLRLQLPHQYETISNKYKQIILNKFTLTANFLHPIYRGKLLTANQRQIVDDYLIAELDPNGLDSLQQFDLNEDIFDVLLEKGVQTPRTYWRLAERKHPNLSKLANKLLRIPASSAYLEKLFDNWSLNYTNLNSQRCVEKNVLSKLAHVYYSLRIKQSDIDSEIEHCDENV